MSEPAKPLQIQLDQLIHDGSRLRIMSLMTHVRTAPFADIQSACDLTPGNLSTHLARLEDAGYVTIAKRPEGRGVATIVTVTARGRSAYNAYIDQWEAITARTGRRQV